MMAMGMMILAANEGISAVRQLGYWVGSFDLPVSLSPFSQGKSTTLILTLSFGHGKLYNLRLLPNH